MDLPPTLDIPAKAAGAIGIAIESTDPAIALGGPETTISFVDSEQRPLAQGEELVRRVARAGNELPG